jgi:hypothetical protein
VRLDEDEAAAATVSRNTREEMQVKERLPSVTPKKKTVPVTTQNHLESVRPNQDNVIKMAN